jgi:hypothetical protein
MKKIMKKINKIIYFDKETINNILQEFNKGSKASQTGTSSSLNGTSEVIVESGIKLSVPFLQRLSFLFSGKLSANYVKQKDKTTTITSTEISEFESIKPQLKNIENIQIEDIENSSTFFRVAGAYLKMMKGGIEEVDVNEFGSVMNNFDGYDTYKINENKYIRFNNLAFVSNYKRNDLLTTRMDIYCISVGKFSREEFDFIKQIDKMQILITGIEKTSSLADMYPPKENETSKESTEESQINRDNDRKSQNMIELFDVLYASISGGKNE